MAKRITPPYGIIGKWTVKSPYKVKAAKEYRCVAIRSFIELQSLGIDIHQRYYQPVELNEQAYRNDEQLGASIVTLFSKDGETIHIPDTYIESYPDPNLGQFRRFVLSCDLGTLPMKTGLGHIKDAVKKAVHDALGRAPLVSIHVGPLGSDSLDDTELSREESNRKSKIVNKKTTYGQYYDLNRKYADLLNYVESLKKHNSTTVSEAAKETQLLKTKLAESERIVSIERAKRQQATLKQQAAEESLVKEKALVQKLIKQVQRLGGTPDI